MILKRVTRPGNEPHPLNSHLTAREVEVIQLLTYELSIKKIADHLGITEKTAIIGEAIKRRLNVLGTTGIVCCAIREGR